jgi:hypothetical protein
LGQVAAISPNTDKAWKAQKQHKKKRERGKEAAQEEKRKRKRIKIRRGEKEEKKRGKSLRESCSPLAPGEQADQAVHVIAKDGPKCFQPTALHSTKLGKRPKVQSACGRRVAPGEIESKDYG